MKWEDLTRTERTLLLALGGGTLAVGILSILTTERLKALTSAGIPVKIMTDEPTRNMVAAATADWTRELHQLTDSGVPVFVRWGKRPEDTTT